MRTLVSIIARIQKFKKEQLDFFSTAYGPVKLISNGPEQIKVSDYKDDIYSFDAYGRIHPKGSCLLYPGTKESWDAYEKRIIDEYYDSLIRIGDVCLVKKNENSDWVLAVYDGKIDGKYKAKIGVESEVWEYCISFTENSSYLGRAMFPDWLIPEDE